MAGAIIGSFLNEAGYDLSTPAPASIISVGIGDICEK